MIGLKSLSGIANCLEFSGALTTSMFGVSSPDVGANLNGNTSKNEDYPKKLIYQDNMTVYDCQFCRLFFFLLAFGRQA